MTEFTKNKRNEKERLKLTCWTMRFKAGFSQRKCKASRTLQVPNLTSVLRTCEVRRMNQLRSTDLYLGRICRSFD